MPNPVASAAQAWRRVWSGRSTCRTVISVRDYLRNLVSRMEAVGWLASDPMYVEAVKSRDALDRMVIALAAAEPAEPAQPRWMRVRGVPPQ